MNISDRVPGCMPQDISRGHEIIPVSVVYDRGICNAFTLLHACFTADNGSMWLSADFEAPFNECNTSCGVETVVMCCAVHAIGALHCKVCDTDYIADSISNQPDCADDFLTQESFVEEHLIIGRFVTDCQWV